jgi:DNA-binding CsgD family transcriptional regulator
MSAVSALRRVPYESGAAEARWSRWLPEWVHRLGAPVWVTGPDGRIVFVNERAQVLLGAPATACIGRPCHEVVASRTASGAAFCRSRCPLVAAAEAGREVEPVEVRVGEACGRAEHWVHLTAIPVDGPDRSGRWIVHTARVEDRARRIEDYVGRLASRSEAIREIDGRRGRAPLSPREYEILDLLAEDVEQGRIASRLGLAPATVRNHVQHLLAKLGAHSIEEAVAMHVLARS